MSRADKRYVRARSDDIDDELAAAAKEHWRLMHIVYAIEDKMDRLKMERARLNDCPMPALPLLMVYADFLSADGGDAMYAAAAGGAASATGGVASATVAASSDAASVTVEAPSGVARATAVTGGAVRAAAPTTSPLKVTPKKQRTE